MTPAALPLYNQAGKKISDVAVSPSLAEEKANPALLHQVVRMIQANQRQGTHVAKTRSEVSGGGEKPWRQKGTGRARAGSNRSPLWRHGGVTFGPKPRHYGYTLPKKMRHAALRATLTAKVKDGEVILVETLTLSEPKTKAFAAILKALGVTEGVLVVAEKATPYLRRAHRNLPGVCLKGFPEVNAYDLLRYPKILAEKGAFAALVKRCGSGEETS